MNLNIGSVQLPINAATKTFAFLAKRGAGKTYTAAVLAEEFAKTGVPFIVFDPIDVWWGLRLAADGKGKGLPVVVFGQENADILIDRDMGRQIAQAVVRENISCVISTFGMPKVAQRHLIAEFAEELLNINKSPRHVFIEEAHEFVPQRVAGGMGKTFAAVEALVVMGRNRGIGVSLINQRAATVNKDVLTQIDTLVALRNVAPQDRKALQDWVEAHSAEGDFEKFIKSLPSLPNGEAWIWSPEFLGIFEKIKIRKRETFHPDREKLGVNFKMPELTQSDIQGFIQKFASEKPAPKVKGGKKSRLPEFTVAQPIGAPHPIIEDHVRKAAEEAALREMKNSYESALVAKDTEINRLTKVITAVRNALGFEGSTTAVGQVQNGSVDGAWADKLGRNRAEGKIFVFLSENRGIPFSRGQIAVRTGARITSSSFQMAMSKLQKLNLIVRTGNDYKLNDSIV